MADSNFYPNEKVVIEAFPEDANNLAAPVVAGSYAWSVDAEGIVALTPGPGGTTCEAAALGEGEVIVTCTAVNLAGSIIDGMADLLVMELPVPVATHIRLVVGPPSPQ